MNFLSYLRQKSNLRHNLHQKWFFFGKVFVFIHIRLKRKKKTNKNVRPTNFCNPSPSTFLIKCLRFNVLFQLISVSHFYWKESIKKCFFFLNLFTVEVQVDGKPLNVTVCDTAGQDVLDPLRQLCYPSTDVFLLCFSVVKPETFQSIERKWVPELAKYDRSLLLIGTHSDLRNDPKTMQQLQVSFYLLSYLMQER